MITSTDMEKQSMKASKPAMEKRRRARINESLQQLKSLVIDGVSKNNSRHSKLEKADILEMTVRYLRNVQRQQMKASVNSEPIDLSQYRSGFAECIGEVSRCGAMDENPEARARLLGHLAGLCTTQQSHRRQEHQPIRYAVVAPGQMQPPAPIPLPLQQPPPSTPVMSSPTSSSPQGLVAMSNNTVTTMATSVHQPMQMTFPSPPLSNGRHVTQPSPHMNSLSFEGTKTGPQVLQAQRPSAKILTKDTSDAQASSMATSEPGKKPPVVMSPPSATNQTPKPTGDVITLILPSQSLPGGQVPTHLIPVYAQEANKGISKPHGIAFPNEEALSAPATPVSCNNSTARGMPVPSPKSASTVPTAVSPGQPATWTVMQVPTAQLISPQVGCVAPQFAITIPSNISPIGLSVQDKQPQGPPVRFPTLAPDFQASADYDSMWRPW